MVQTESLPRVKWGIHSLLLQTADRQLIEPHQMPHVGRKRDIP